VSADAKRRAFVAIDLAAEVREALGREREALEALPWAKDVRWVAGPNQHLTLRFLGDVERSFCTDLLRELEPRVCEIASFTFTAQGLTAFPSARRPRVIAAEVDAEKPLAELARAVEDAVVAAGGAPEARRFRPHITLGRFRKPPRGPLDLSAWCVECPESMEVREVMLFRSELGPKGANYSALGRIALGARSPRGDVDSSITAGSDLHSGSRTRT